MRLSEQLLEYESVKVFKEAGKIYLFFSSTRQPKNFKKQAVHGHKVQI
jgi:hypothetical protein